MKIIEEPKFCPILALCEYEGLTFLVDNLTIILKEWAPRVQTCHIKAKFGSPLQLSFFKPLIIEKSKKKQYTKLIIKPNFGLDKPENWLRFYNVKPDIKSSKNNELFFDVKSRRGRLFVLGEKQK